jgi:hypothetical protein
VAETPAAQARPFLRARWRTLAAFAGVAFVYLYSFPYFAQVHNANEVPRIELTEAMVDHGHFYIDDANAHEPVVDVAGPLSVDAHGKVLLGDPHGHVYSNKAPGQSFLGIPFYLLAKLWARAHGRAQPTAAEITFALRVGTGALPSLLFLPLLWALLGLLFPGEETVASRRIALCAYALGTMALQYSILLYSHQLSAVGVGSAYALCALRARGRGRDWWVAAAGFLASFATACDYQAAFVAAPVFVYALVTVKSRAKTAAWFAAGGLPPAVLLLYYHTACFGRPWRTAYSYTLAFMHFHEQGFLGLRGPAWVAFKGSLWAPDNGLFFFSPFLLLAIPGLVLMLRKSRGPSNRADGVLSLWVLAFFVYFVSSIAMWRGGWEIGPRYVTVALPFLCAPVVALLEAAREARVGRGLAVGLCLASIAIYVTACSTFPLYQDDAGYKNPLYEVTFRLLGGGYAPYNLGRVVGLHGGWSDLPLWLVTSGLVLLLATDGVTGPALRRVRQTVVSMACAAALLLAYARLPRASRSADPAVKDHALRSFDYVTRIFEPKG